MKPEATAEELTARMRAECDTVDRVTIKPHAGGHEYTLSFSDGSDDLSVRVLDGGDKSAENVTLMLSASIESRGARAKA